MILIVSISSSLKDNVIVLIVGVMIGNITLSVISIWHTDLGLKGRKQL